MTIVTIHRNDIFNPFQVHTRLWYFGLANARRFYSSMGDLLGREGLRHCKGTFLNILLHQFYLRIHGSEKQRGLGFCINVAKEMLTFFKDVFTATKGIRWKASVFLVLSFVTSPTLLAFYTSFKTPTRQFMLIYRMVDQRKAAQTLVCNEQFHLQNLYFKASRFRRSCELCSLAKWLP